MAQFSHRVDFRRFRRSVGIYSYPILVYVRACYGSGLGSWLGFRVGGLGLRVLACCVAGRVARQGTHKSDN